MRILVRGARAFVDETALFQFGKGQSAGGDGMILVKHFVGFSIKENAPITWCTKLERALGEYACSAIACNSVVPTRILVQGVEGVYVFAKSFASLRGRGQRVVKINVLASIVSA